MSICGKKSIYLDTCTYNRPFDNQAQLRISLETQAKLYIQTLIKNNELDLIYSYVCFYENYMNPHENKKLSIYDFSKNAKTYIIENNDVLEKAKEIEKRKIKPLDALHLSCAMSAQADFFITVDDVILKYNTNEIKIFDPILFIKYWEKHGGNDE